MSLSTGKSDPSVTFVRLGNDRNTRSQDEKYRGLDRESRPPQVNLNLNLEGR